MLIPNVVRLCSLTPRSQEEPPRAWWGTQLSLFHLLALEVLGSTCQHTRWCPPLHIFYLISSSRPGNQSERTAGSQLAPKSRAVTSLGLCSSTKLFKPQ